MIEKQVMVGVGKLLDQTCIIESPAYVSGDFGKKTNLSAAVTVECSVSADAEPEESISAGSVALFDRIRLFVKKGVSISAGNVVSIGGITWDVVEVHVDPHGQDLLSCARLARRA